MTAFNLSFLNCRQPNQNIPTTSKLAKSSLDIEGYHYNNCTCTIAATMTSPLVNDASKNIRDYREMQAIDSLGTLEEGDHDSVAKKLRVRKLCAFQAFFSKQN